MSALGMLVKDSECGGKGIIVDLKFKFVKDKFVILAKVEEELGDDYIIYTRELNKLHFI